MRNLLIQTEKSYPLIFSSYLINYDFLLKKNQKIVLITDDNLKALYGEKLKNHLLNQCSVELISMPAGENFKTRETKSQLEDEMLLKKMGRDTLVIALGGGVVLDMAGFVAATYCRGIPVIYLPTSLLAMLDASIGGKVAVNTPQGKNLIGVFKQPEAVIVDVEFLKTIPIQEFYNGMAEHIKHALIQNPILFEKIEKHLDINEQAIYDSILIKKNIVELDEFELGMRKILNAGHTVAHALEKYTNYQMPHGQAVALGLLIEAKISEILGILPISDFQRIEKVLLRIPYQYSFSIPEKDIDLLIEYMAIDKKSINQQPYFCLLESIGSVYKNKAVPVIEKTIRAACYFVLSKQVPGSW